MDEIDKKARDLFIHYGSASSEAMFDFPYHFFQIPDCIGMILYRIDFNCAIVFGDPLCPSEEMPKITKAFHEFCQKSKLNVIYIIVSQNFAKWAMHECKISVEICKELIFNPQTDLMSKRLQQRVNKAIKHGLTLYEYIPFDAEIEENFKQIALKWQQSIKGPNLYIGHFNFFDNYTGKRWFYIKDDNQITAMAMLSQIKEGWLLKFFMTLPSAFPETSEFLMSSILEILKKENCQFLTKGSLPVNSLNQITGLGNIFIFFSKFFYRMISRFFKFQKRKEYWFRYNPQSLPTYLLFYRSSIGINEARALMKAFKGNK